MKILIPFFLVILAFNAKGQSPACNLNIDSVVINGTSYLNPDTINVCQGGVFYVYSTAYCLDSLLADNFNAGSLNPGWISNCSPMFNNPCGPGPDGSTYLWIGPATNFPRELVTGALNVNAQGQICFDMKYASQANSSPCEGPDESTEGVHLQWSLSQTGPWNEINYWDPAGGYDFYLTTWHQYCENIPVTGMAYFRWYQNTTSGNDYDHWGIDNVRITAPATTPWSLEWNDGTGIISSDEDIAVSPTHSTVYTLNLNAGTVNLSDYFVVNIIHPSLSIGGLDTHYYSNDPPLIITGNPQPGTFSGPGILQPNIFSPIAAGPGTHTITWEHYVMGTSYSYGNHTVFEDDFSTDKGWTGYGSGGWDRGSATASIGCSGGQDPAQDHTPTADNYIIGTYIGGCYANSMAQTYWLTSPVIDCSGFSNCTLDFWSFSGCESMSWDRCYIDIYNGTSWTSVFSNTSSFSDLSWTHKSYNIPTNAITPDFKVRFGLGPTDGSVTYQGWNIDDLKIICTGSVPIYDTLCTLTYSQQVVVEYPNGTEKNEGETGIKVYPNPAGDILYIQVEKNHFQQYSLTDVTGKLIITGPVKEKQNEIKLSEIPSGTYVLKVDDIPFTIIKN